MEKVFLRTKLNPKGVCICESEIWEEKMSIIDELKLAAKKGLDLNQISDECPTLMLAIEYADSISSGWKNELIDAICEYVANGGTIVINKNL